MSKDKNLLIDIWLVSALTYRLVDQLLEDTPLSADEFALYGLLGDLGPVTAAQLARWTGLPPTTLSNLIRRCEQRGELTKVPNPEDGRSQLLTLSDRGMDLYHKLVPRLFEAVGALHAALSPSDTSTRLALQDLDRVLRTTLGVEPRPYEVASPGTDRALAYVGDTLNERQRQEVLDYITWLRHRDAARKKERSA